MRSLSVKNQLHPFNRLDTLPAYFIVLWTHYCAMLCKCGVCCGGPVSVCRTLSVCLLQVGVHHHHHHHFICSI